MITEATNNVTSTYNQMPPPAPEKVETSRKLAQKNPEQVIENAATSAVPAVHPEEILSKIKALAQEGLYSVNFEIDPKTNQLIVKLVDSQTQKVIRQVPAQAMLGLKEAMSSYQGNIIDKKS
jgi:flagellar protein FlaG